MLKVEINPRDAMVRRASIIGMLLFNATNEEKASVHAALYAGLESGTGYQSKSLHFLKAV